MNTTLSKSPLMNRNNQLTLGAAVAGLALLFVFEGMFDSFTMVKESNIPSKTKSSASPATAAPRVS